MNDHREESTYMKLLMIAPELYSVPSPQGTSVETCMYHIAKRLAERHQVTVICRRNQGLPRISVDGKLRIVRVRAENRGMYISSVIRWARGRSFDYIQIDNRPRFVSKIKKNFPKTPISVFLHSLTYVRSPKTSNQIVRRQLAQATVIIANSRSLKQQLVSRFPKLSKKIKVVHLGVDLLQFRPPSKSERRNIRRKYNAVHSFTIVYAGRFIPLKGIPVLIKAAEMVRRRIPNAKLYLAGSGKKSYKAYIKKIAKRAKIPIYLMGTVPRRLMHKVYWMADCFVCPTQGHESFGLVVAESLATGTPTVASRNGGIQEIIRHQHNGLLVNQYRNPSAFAKGIFRLGKDRKFARRCGRNGRETCVSRFHWKLTVKRLERLYQK